jgi:hypothetical protein
MFRLKPMAGFVLAAAVLAVTSTTASYGATARPSQTSADPAQHVLLISVDGLHQSDLRWWIQHHPDSVLARIADTGTQYTNAATPVPSDSFPRLVAQVTGGDPRTTGVYYDDSYNRRLLPPGSSCTPGQTSGLGTEVTYFEVLDRNLNSIDAAPASRTSTRAFPPACSRCPAASPRSSSG